jgi:hypothetical protein
MYFTRRVVAWHATCQSPIGSYRLLGGKYIDTWYIDTWHIFDRTVHVYQALIGRPTNLRNLKTKLRTGREYSDTWHAYTWHILIERSTFTELEPATSEWYIVKKYDLPRQICSFCVSAVSSMESSFFCLESAFLLQAAGLLGLRFRAPNGVTSRASTALGGFPPSGPDCHVAHVTRVNCSLVDTVLKPPQHAACQQLTRGITWLVHVASSATCQALIGPYHFWCL